MNFFLGKLILKLLTRIGEWHENVSEYTGHKGCESARAQGVQGHKGCKSTRAARHKGVGVQGYQGVRTV